MAAERSPLADLNIDAYASPVLDALRELRRAHGRVVVVGHSITGVLLHHLGESEPEAIQRLVYVAATAPGPGRSVAMDTLEEQWASSLFPPLLVADPAAVGALRINPRSADPRYGDDMRRCFFNDVSPTMTEVARRLLTCDNPGVLSTHKMALTAERWGSLPRSWIRTTGDRAIPVVGQDTNISQLDGNFVEHRFDVLTIDTGHMPFLSSPRELARNIYECAS
jgi:pimeloyl-ACP methyl ester carboxylesterase